MYQSKPRHIFVPDELLELCHHPLGLGRHVARLGRADHGARASFVLAKAEADGLVLAVSSHRDEELTLVPVLLLLGRVGEVVTMQPGHQTTHTHNTHTHTRETHLH